jgi:hypothetical protein
MTHDTEQQLRHTAARLNTEADTTTQSNLRRRMLERFAEAATAHAAPFALPRLTQRFAASLLLATALAFGAWLLIGEGGPTTAYAQLTRAIENSRKAQWIQAVDPNDPNYINLLSFNPIRAYGRFHDGRLQANLTDKNTQYTYIPITNTLEITYLAPTPMDQAGDVFEMIKIYLDQFSLSLQKKISQDSTGKKVWVFSSELNENNPDKSIHLTVDPATERIVRFRFEDAANPEYTLDFPFTYPEKGPADIYDFGVPRDAKVVDYTPSQRMFEFNRQRTQATLAGLAPAYRTVVVSHTSRSQEWDEAMKGHANIHAESVNDWLRETQPNPVATRWFTLQDDDSLTGLSPDGVEYYTWGLYSKQQHLIFKSVEQFDGDRLTVNDYRDPQVYLDKVNGNYPKLQTHRYDLARGGALIESKSEHKTQFPWLHDPNWMGDPPAADYDPTFHSTDHLRVLEYQQSPAGQWYATRLQRRTKHHNQPEKVSDITIFVDFNPDPFPEGFFDETQ